MVERSPLGISIRRERPADAVRVETVECAAFGGPGEAALVGILRATQPHLSLVAEAAGQVVGHVLFSPVRVESRPDAAPAAGLAPLAVDPPFQRRGVGGALVRAGLRACPDLGWRAVFVLGDPDYYARFGFGPAAPRGLHYERGRFAREFQLLELEPGALGECAGRVRYPDAFYEL